MITYKDIKSDQFLKLAAYSKTTVEYILDVSTFEADWTPRAHNVIIVIRANGCFIPTFLGTYFF